MVVVVVEAVTPPKPAGSGKWAAPKSGEPHTKTIDGKEKHYCSTCRGGKGTWTNHLTKDHVVGYKKDNGAGTPATPTASLARFDPVTWMA